MKNILYSYCKLFAYRLNKIPKKYRLFLAGIICAIYIGLFYLLNHFVKMPLDMMVYYIVLFLTYMFFIYLPIKIYFDFFKQKKIELLFLSPVSLFSCFNFMYWKQILKLIFFAILLILPLLYKKVPLFFILFKYIPLISFYILFLYTIIFSVLSGLFLIFKKNIYQYIMLFIGTLEIVGFFLAYTIYGSRQVMGLHVMRNNLQSLVSKIKYDNHLLVGFICIDGILFLISWILYRQSYYKNDFMGSTGYNDMLSKGKKEPLNLVFVYKDFRYLIRDFMNYKYIVVTFLIFIYTLVYGKRNVNFKSVCVYLAIFISIFSFQYIIENVKNEKSKMDLYILSNMSIYKFFKQKIVANELFVGGMTFVLCIIISLLYKYSPYKICFLLFLSTCLTLVMVNILTYTVIGIEFVLMPKKITFNLVLKILKESLTAFVSLIFLNIGIEMYLFIGKKQFLWIKSIVLFLLIFVILKYSNKFTAKKFNKGFEVRNRKAENI